MTVGELEGLLAQEKDKSLPVKSVQYGQPVDVTHVQFDNDELLLLIDC